jgi:hypothetical protein
VTTGQFDGQTGGVPVIKGMPILTGIGADQTMVFNPKIKPIIVMMTGNITVGPASIKKLKTFIMIFIFSCRDQVNIGLYDDQCWTSCQGDG